MTRVRTPASPTAGAGSALRTQGPDVSEPCASSPHDPLRWCAMAAYVALLITWSRLVGIPGDPVQLVVWTWLALLIWNIGGGWSAHRQFLRDWTLPALVLVAYTYAGGIADRLGMPVHTRAPIAIGEWIGHGHTAPEALQHAWCGDPCNAGIGAHWYDTLFTFTYLTHFVTAPAIAGALYLVDRQGWASWMRRYLLLNACGLAAYILYPMAPPLMASQDGLLHSHVTRLTGRGGAALGLQVSQLIMGQHVNQVAAMPSLHVGVATLVAGFLFTRLRQRGRIARTARWLVIGYPLLMTLAVIYLGEHYLLDSAFGALLAVGVLAACTRWEAWRAIRRGRIAVRRVEALQAEAQATRRAEFEAERLDVVGIEAAQEQSRSA